MATLRVRIEEVGDTLAGVAQAWRSAETDVKETRDATLAFGSWEDVHRVLAPKRLAIVRAMTGHGTLSIREVARRVGRDFKSVHSDVDTLWRNGVLDKSSQGIVFPYDRIHLEFDIEAAA
jgi:predicted transcriptional regulator